MANNGGNSVTKINLSTFATVGSALTVGSNPYSIAIAPSTGYTVTFNANGGTGSLASEGPYSVATALSLFSTGTMAYAGYAFTGWNTARQRHGHRLRRWGQLPLLGERHPLCTVGTCSHGNNH